MQQVKHFSFSEIIKYVPSHSDENVYQDSEKMHLSSHLHTNKSDVVSMGY